MRNQQKDEVKAIVYCANIVEERRSQDIWLGVFMVLSAFAIVGLRYLA